MHPAPALAMRTPAFMLCVRGLLLNDGEGVRARGCAWSHVVGFWGETSVN